MHETLNRTGLISLKSGSHVNLERAMTSNGRFGGHIVAGHIDGIGKVKRTWKDDNAIWYNMSELSNSESGMEFDTEKIKAVLEEALDFSKPKLDDGIIDKFVSQIIPVDNCRYRWDLNFLPNETQSLVCKVEGRKNHADATIEEGNEDEDESPRTYVLSMDYSNISVTAKNAYQSYVLHRQLLAKSANQQLANNATS